MHTFFSAFSGEITRKLDFFAKKVVETFGGIVRKFYLCTRKRQGALVQLVRIHACHAWGHGFESRTHRNVDLQNLEEGA